jgi:hypothetical protein
VRTDLRPGLPAEIAKWIEKDGVEATAHRMLEMPQEAVFDVRSLSGSSDRSPASK